MRKNKGKKRVEERKSLVRMVCGVVEEGEKADIWRRRREEFVGCADFREKHDKC